jgi:hypothetical protein
MNFTIFCDGMLIVQHISTDVLLEPAANVQDRKFTPFWNQGSSAMLL